MTLPRPGIFTMGGAAAAVDAIANSADMVALDSDHKQRRSRAAPNS